MRADVLALLADLQRALRPLGIRWFLFGAQAVVAHGVPRMSDDVDITVELGRVKPAALVEALATRGFDLLIEEEPGAFVEETRVLPFAHRPTGVALDVVVAGPGIEEGILDRSIVMKLSRLRLPVVAAEDLIVLKVLAGRGKDLDDVEGILLRKAKELDETSVRDRLKELEDLLGQSDLLPQFDRIAASVQKRLPARSPRKPSRKRRS